MKLFFTLFSAMILAFGASAQIKYRVVAANVLDLNGFVENDTARIAWKVSDNEKGNVFEVEKSADGITFKTLGIVLGSNKPGMEEYEFKGILQKENTAFYRLRVINRDNQSGSHSKVIQLKNNRLVRESAIRVLNSSTASQLGFAYQSEVKGPGEVSVYNISGAKVYSGRVFTTTGSNLFTLNVNGGIKGGVYILEVRNSKERTAIKFIKG